MRKVRGLLLTFFYELQQYGNYGTTAANTDENPAANAFEEVFRGESEIGSLVDHDDDGENHH